MSSLTRMLAVLDLFTGDTPSWTAEAIAEHLDYSVPTVYRYVRELCGAGLLRGESGANFVLGPKIIELDYQIRTGDPLITSGRDSMRKLADATGCDVVLVTDCGGHVVTIHQEFGTEGISASYGRGRRMPLFRGAMSKCLLAALPRPQLRKLYTQNMDEAHREKFSESWETLLAETRQIRQDGFAVSQGELDAENVGIAVPLTSASHKIVAAMGFIMSKQRFSMIEVERTVAMLKACTSDIQAKMTAPSSSDYLSLRASRSG